MEQGMAVPTAGAAFFMSFFMGKQINPQIMLQMLHPP